MSVEGWKRVLVMGLILMGAGILLSSCGSSSDGDEDFDEVTELLDSYSFGLQIFQESPNLTVTLGEGGALGTAVLSTNTRQFGGTFQPVSEVLTLTAGSGLEIDSDLIAGPEGSFTITVTEDIEIDVDLWPDGVFQVFDGLDTITVTLENTPVPGVSVSNGTDTASLSFDDFEEIFGSTAPTWQQQAGLAYSVLGFVVEQIYFVVETIGYIGENEDFLIDNPAPIVTTCDAFPAGAAPAGVPQQGSRTFTWDDISGNADPGPEDGFSWEFDNCWEDDPDDDIDTLIDGRVELIGFSEISETRNNIQVITRVGFEPYLEADGGVEYTDLVICEVEESPPGTFTIDTESIVTVNGGFSISFFE
ncbi:MAG: hypothetical protein ACP5G0_08905 [Desulfomonilia bacterium]